jgi:hypothetical protein
LPIADERQNKEKNCNEQQSARLGSIKGMMVPMFVLGKRLGWQGHSHEDIVDLECNRRKPEKNRPDSTKINTWHLASYIGPL